GVPHALISWRSSATSSRLGNLVSSHWQNRIVVDRFINHHDIAAIGDVPENAWPATAATDAGGFGVLQNMVNIIGRQVMRFNVLHVATGRAVPDDLRPFHATSSAS